MTVGELCLTNCESVKNSRITPIEAIRLQWHFDKCTKKLRICQNPIKKECWRLFCNPLHVDCIGDALRPHIGVGGDNAVRPLAHFALKLQDGLVPVPGQRLIDAVPGDGGKFQPGDALLPGDFHGFGHRGLGVDRPHVGNYFDTMLLGGLEHLCKAVFQQTAVALGGVLQHFLPGQADGALGQALKDDVVQPALLDQGDGRVNAVAGKAGAASNANFFHSIQSHNLFVAQLLQDQPKHGEQDQQDNGEGPHKFDGIALMLAQVQIAHTGHEQGGGGERGDGPAQSQLAHQGSVADPRAGQAHGRGALGEDGQDAIVEGVRIKNQGQRRGQHAHQNRHKPGQGAGDQADQSVGHGGGHAGLGEYAHQHTGAVQGADHKHRIGTVEAHDLLLILHLAVVEQPSQGGAGEESGGRRQDTGDHQPYHQHNQDQVGDNQAGPQQGAGLIAEFLSLGFHSDGGVVKALRLQPLGFGQADQHDRHQANGNSDEDRDQHGLEELGEIHFHHSGGTQGGSAPRGDIHQTCPHC